MSQQQQSPTQHSTSPQQHHLDTDSRPNPFDEQLDEQPEIDAGQDETQATEHPDNANNQSNQANDPATAAPLDPLQDQHAEQQEMHHQDHQQQQQQQMIEMEMQQLQEQQDQQQHQEHQSEVMYSHDSPQAADHDASSHYASSPVPFTDRLAQVTAHLPPPPQILDPRQVLPQLNALSTCVSCRCKLYTAPPTLALMSNNQTSSRSEIQPLRNDFVACLHGRCQICCNRLSLPCVIHKLPLLPFAEVHNAALCHQVNACGAFKSLALARCESGEARVRHIDSIHDLAVQHASGVPNFKKQEHTNVLDTCDGIISGVHEHGFIVSCIVAGVVHKGFISTRPCAIKVFTLHSSSIVQLLERGSLVEEQNSKRRLAEREADQAQLQGKKRRYVRSGMFAKKAQATNAQLNSNSQQSTLAANNSTSANLAAS